MDDGECYEDSDYEEEEYYESEYTRFMKDFPQGLGIQPYMYEPTRSASDSSSVKSYGKESDNIDWFIDHFDDDEEEEEEEEESECEEEEGNKWSDERVGNTNWCKCTKCVVATKARESHCCADTVEILEKMEETEQHLTCVTFHKAFLANCLDKDVLEVSFWHHVQGKACLFPGDCAVNKLFQKIAYQRFATWIWKLQRKRKRHVLPSCVVAVIKEQFPSDPADFKYPKIPKDYTY
ncbi:uncharacterized protein [Antedon mediterranea]|uniref:uncharacterized protein n=1 Tax=Antedon mediterranea TaxID=105859 RepID=UPI003AF8AFBE